MPSSGVFPIGSEDAGSKAVRQGRVAVILEFTAPRAGHVNIGQLILEVTLKDAPTDFGQVAVWEFTCHSA